MYSHYNDPTDIVGPEEGYTITTHNSEFEAKRRVSNKNPYTNAVGGKAVSALLYTPDRTPMFASTTHQALKESIYPAAMANIEGMGTNGEHPLESGEYVFTGVSKATTNMDEEAAAYNYGTVNMRTTVTHQIKALEDFAWDLSNPHTQNGMKTAAVRPMRLLESEVSLRQAKRIAHDEEGKAFRHTLIELMKGCTGSTLSHDEIKKNMNTNTNLSTLQLALMGFSTYRRKRLALRGGRSLRNYPAKTTNTFYAFLDNGGNQ